MPPNPVRWVILSIGLALARIGLVDESRAKRVVDLAWPRVLAGLARMSRVTADVAMVGMTVGSAGVAGIGFAAPFTAAAHVGGGGIAAGAMALISQRYGAEAYDALGQVVRTGGFLTAFLLVPIGALYWTFPTQFIQLLASDETTSELGAKYLRVVALTVPFAGLNMLGVRTLVGTDDAWTAMVIRSGGAGLNILLNAVFIFDLRLGVTGAALGTLISTIGVSLGFAFGLHTGRLPGIGRFPVSVSLLGQYVHRSILADLVEIGVPVAGRNLVLTVARFPILGLVGVFGPAVVAAYVISWRIARLMNVPGWGFGLAASSLIGQSLGKDDETLAESYCRDITTMAVTTYFLVALTVGVFAKQILTTFVTDPTGRVVAVGVPLVYAACIAVVFRGITSSVAGALDASGDTRWPFYGRTLGMFGFVIPLAYMGATTPLGLWGLYCGYLAQTIVPAAVNYYRFSTGAWKRVSQQYRPAVDS